MKTENLLLFAGLGVAAYWVYETYFKATPAGTTAQTTSVLPAGSALTTLQTQGVPLLSGTLSIPNPANPSGTPLSFVVPPVNYNGQSLAAIYSRMAQGVTGVATGVQYTADQWNTFMGQASTVTPPDAGLVFSFTSSFPRTTPMTLAQYWSAMEPYLAAHGMSGLGLFAGMGRFYRRGRG